MVPDRKSRTTLLLPALVLLLAALPASAQAPAAGEWKLFQEFNFVAGSWSGSAESGGRIGGRVVTVGPEVDGATLRYRATTYYPAKDNLPESRSEEIAHIVYDGAKASTPPSSSSRRRPGDLRRRVPRRRVDRLRLQGDVEPGGGDPLPLDAPEEGRRVGRETLEVAPPARDFVTFLSATLTKK